MQGNKIQDRLMYAQALANHIDRISHAGEHLFDHQENADGQATLPTISSKLQSFWAQIQLFESFIFPSLSRNYFAEIQSSKKILKNWEQSNQVLFAESQKVLQSLMMEAHNSGLLFHSVSDENEEPEENAAED